MPTYEYECESCGNRFEMFQSMSDDPVKRCPKCGKKVRRLIGGGLGVIFKGSGFYVTDNKRSANGGADRATAKVGSENGKNGESSGSKSGGEAAASSGSSAGEKTAKPADSGKAVKDPA